MSEPPIRRGSAEWQARMQLHLQALQRQIADDGHVIQSVFPTAETGGFEFCYTVGLTAAGLPELLMSSLPIAALEPMLDLAAARHRAEPFTDGTVWECPATAYTRPTPLRARQMPGGHPSLGMAYRLYGPRVSGLQLLWSHPPGLFPGEQGHVDEGLSQDLAD